MLDWTERLTLALLVVFSTTLALVSYADDPVAWVLWGALMALLTGSTLVLVNRGS